MRLTCAALTDPGRRRENNEDSFCVREDLGLFLVADGMGGHVAGEIASKLAVDEIERLIEASAAAASAPGNAAPPRAGRDPGSRLDAAFAQANRKLADRMAADASLHGMATTAVALLAGGRSAALAHVGDSRAYRWRSRDLVRLTRDHSWVEDQIRSGVLTPDAARRHPWRHVVTRALAGTPDADAEVLDLALEPDDRVLLCSDGLSSVVSDDGIAAVLREARPAADLCAELVRLANAEGGPDNVTVVLVDVHAD